MYKVDWHQFDETESLERRYNALIYGQSPTADTLKALPRTVLVLQSTRAKNQLMCLGFNVQSEDGMGVAIKPDWFCPSLHGYLRLGNVMTTNTDMFQLDHSGNPLVLDWLVKHEISGEMEVVELGIDPKSLIKEIREKFKDIIMTNSHFLTESFWAAGEPCVPFGWRDMSYEEVEDYIVKEMMEVAYREQCMEN